jgi:hypothetical protein
LPKTRWHRSLMLENLREREAQQAAAHQGL